MLELSAGLMVHLAHKLTFPLPYLQSYLEVSIFRCLFRCNRRLSKRTHFCPFRGLSIPALIPSKPHSVHILVSCGADKFECKNYHWWKQCIDIKYRCDGHPQCADESDEMDCRKLEIVTILSVNNK